MIDLLILAVEGGEGIPGEHIAAKLAVPIGILIFCGSVYLLLWANYGAKKGAAIYGTAMFGFTTMLGVFWWFGAPGTPVATGLQNFPGQAPDAYQGAWYGFEQGSERAGFFDVTDNPEDFQTVAAYTGQPDASPEELESDPMASFIAGDLEGATTRMIELYLPRDENGTLLIGAERRSEYLEAAGDPQQGESRAEQFFTAEATERRVTDNRGVRVARAEIVVSANFVGEGGAERQVEVDVQPLFAFKDPGALWFPSAVWTGVSFLLFLGSLFLLDRIEQREKRLEQEVEEPEDLAVPVAQ